MLLLILCRPLKRFFSFCHNGRSSPEETEDLRARFLVSLILLPEMMLI